VRISSGSYCPAHAQEREHARSARRRAGGDIRITHDWRFRIRPAVLARDGYRCTYIDENGVRCPETKRLEVHHVTGDPAVNDQNLLVTVCHAHHPRKRRHTSWPPR
jgi:hypothetical protein